MALSVANILNATAGAGVLALLAAASLADMPGADVGIDPIVTASQGISKSPVYDHYMLVDHRSNRSCLVALYRAPGYDVHRVEAGEECSDIHASLADARVWHETPQGEVTLADIRGNKIMSLAPGDGMAYEVLAPANVLLSMEAF